MFTIGTAAYKLYSASSQVGSTLSTLSNYHKYVTEAIFNSPSEVENLHPLVKQNLDRLARRIQVLSSPLNYCLLWSQHRGSAVAETIHQSKEVLKQTYHWLHKCNKDKSKLSDKEYMLRKLDEHIHEIDFCLQSLNLALSIIQTTDSIMPSNKDIEAISPSSLLTASNRIMAMHNSGGDVAICFGQLFRKSILQNTRWQRIYRRSALKIYRNGVRRFYELRIECNEYGYDSDEDCFGNDMMNESHPLTLKFDLTQSIYLTTLSSLIIDLPNNRFHSSFTKANININNLNKHDLIEDAFGWVKMLANQVQEQYIFVLKSGLDDWDKPLSSTDDDDHEDNTNNTVPPQIHTPTSAKSTPSKFRDEEEDHEHDDIVSHDHYRTELPTHVHHMDPMATTDDAMDHQLTASIASLDTAVQQARHRTHLGSLLAPGGDYDESHVTPQLMAYMTRLAIYENDYTKPHTVHHTNSTFKKYKMIHEEEKKHTKEREMEKDESNDNSDVMMKTSLTKEQSNASASSSTSSPATTTTTTNGSQSEYDGISNDEFKIKEKQKIPAHLNASDEELYLFLRNPPTPPIPFYPQNIHFKNEDTKRRMYRNTSTRPYKKRMNIRKGGQKSPNRHDDSKRKAYFAAPKKKRNEVTITYPVADNGNLMDKQPRKRREKKEIARMVNVEEENRDVDLSLSISDENHMKHVENEGTKTDLSPKTTTTSMAAIKDATNSSLLDHVELMSSQNVSAMNSPRNEPNHDEEMLHGNFANLSIDNADDLY
eukprot:16355_1